MHIVELHVTANNMEILSVSQQRFYGLFMSPATIKCYLGLPMKCPIFLSNFNEIWIFLTEFHEVPNTKHHGNPSSGRCADTSGDRQTKGRTWWTKRALFTTMQTQLKMKSQIIVFITQMQIHKVKKSSEGLIKSLLNWEDTMIKSCKTGACKKAF